MKVSSIILIAAVVVLTVGGFLENESLLFAGSVVLFVGFSIRLLDID